MIRTLALSLTTLTLLWVAAAPARESAYPAPPQELFGELYAAVQMAKLFPDGKKFADAVPKSAPAQIMADYRHRTPATVDELRSFVSAHFSLPPEIVPAPAAPDKTSIVEHIDRLWEPLTRRTPQAPLYSSLLALPHPYVVPGGRFREIYYWDSYFTMLGLVQSGRQALVEDMVRDFAYLIDKYGHVPNGARSYYLSRSQPPFFFEMVALLSPDDPAAADARYLPQLRREYAFWMAGAKGLETGTARLRTVALADGSILNRYYDDRDTPRDESFKEDTDLAAESGREPHQLFRDIRAAAESGWDFGSRWFADGKSRATLDTTEILPIDLNSLLFGLERAIAAGCRAKADEACARHFEHSAAARRAAIDRYLWDETAGAYYDYRWTRRERIARVSAATLYPLFAGLASPAQAAAVAKTTERELLRAGGVVTTPLATGQQWDSPNGWAPVQWITVEGLRQYGQAPLAALVACRWMAGVNAVYAGTGKLVEKYDVVTTERGGGGGGGGGGEYPLQDGFGWTNGVMRKLMALYPAASAYENAQQCRRS